MIDLIFSRKTLLLCAVLVVFIIPAQASTPTPAPQKGGLASLYPGVEGIERDPHVLFVDDFETGTPEDIGARWGSISKKENFKLSADIHTGSPGNQSIHISKNGHLFSHNCCRQKQDKPCQQTHDHYVSNF